MQLFVSEIIKDEKSHELKIIVILRSACDSAQFHWFSAVSDSAQLWLSGVPDSAQLDFVLLLTYLSMYLSLKLVIFILTFVYLLQAWEFQTF